MHAWIAVNVALVNNRHSWSNYLRALSPNQREIAAKSGASQSTVSRWFSGSVVPDARTVIALARAYKVSPVAALVAAEYLDSSELGMELSVPARLALQSYTDHELAVEMLRRVEKGSHPELENPLDGDHPAMQEVFGDQDNVTPISRRNVSGYVDDSLQGIDTAAGSDETQADED